MFQGGQVPVPSMQNPDIAASVARRLTVIASLWLVSCVGPRVQTMRLSDSTSEELRQSMKVYTRPQLDEGRVERLGAITAVSCKNKFWDSASEQDAVDQLLYKASLAGGTGIADVSCESEGTNFAKNCWSSYTCHAAIIKLSRALPREGAFPAAVLSGTGLVVSVDGHILTNSHVIAGAQSITVTLLGETLPASLVREDSQNDLAIIKVNRRTVPLAFRSGGRVRGGDAVTIIGFPLSNILSKEPHITTGSITALSGINGDVRFLQVSAPMQSGNSGGPVLDESGRVIGVAVGQLDALKLALATGSVPQNVNFAIKGSIATTFMEAIGISFAVSQQAERRSVSDIAEEARSALVYIEAQPAGAIEPSTRR